MSSGAEMRPLAAGEKTPLLLAGPSNTTDYSVLRIENATRVGGSGAGPASLRRRRSKSFSDLEAAMDQLQSKSAASRANQPPGIAEEGAGGDAGSVCADEAEHRPRRSRLYYVKVGFIFLIVLVSCAIIAATPEKESLFHLYTVSKTRSPSINVTPSINSYSVVLVKLRGALLYSPTETSANITVTVDEVFSAENMSQSLVWTVPIVPVVENDLSEEIVRERYFPLNQTAHKGMDKLSIRIRTSYEQSLPLAVSYETLTNAVYNEVIYAALVLAFVYALIIFELVHRSLAAMLGSLMSVAVLALVNRRPSLTEVIAWLDFETLSLLFGMMVMVGIFSESGFFDWVAVLAFRLARGRTMALVTLLCLFAAVISAFLDNVTTILLMAPVTIRLCEVLRLDPRQLLIAQVMFSNVGGTATAVGDPPNVIIASNAELAEQGVNFTNFTLHMTLGILFVTAAAYALLRLVYWRQDLESTEDPVAAEIRREVEVWRRTAYGFAVTTSEQAAVKALLQAKICELEHRLAVHRVTATAEKPFQETLAELQQKYGIKDKELLIKCSIVLSVVILLFFLSSTVESLHLDLGWIAVMGGIALLVLTDFADMDTLLHRIEWSTLIFFAALFALMEALRELGLIAWIGDQMKLVILALPESSRLPVAILIVLWVSALASAFIDNIPFTTAMIPIILELADVLPILPLVWSLAFGACLGGNGTVIGASANVVAAGIAEQNGYPFTFVQFFRVGFPMMVCTVTVAMLYLLVCHSLIGWNYY